jgi:hypothetical protein
MNNEPLVVDFRLFKGVSAIGMINAMIGYVVDNPKCFVLINQKNDELIRLLKKYEIGPRRIITKASEAEFNNKIVTFLLPFQRVPFDIFVKAMFGKACLQTFVHDLHFLSSRVLLRGKDNFIVRKIKAFLYLLTIKFSTQIFVDSQLVGRQISYILGRETRLYHLRRYFKKLDVPVSPKSKDIDFFIKLDVREYKGLWALDRVIFKNPNSCVGIEAKHALLALPALSRRNPHLRYVLLDSTTEIDLIRAYMRSKVVLCLSRHEGFGFLPYEAAYFGSTPVTLKATSFIENSKNISTLRFLDLIEVESPQFYSLTAEMQALSRRHVCVI